MLLNTSLYANTGWNVDDANTMVRLLTPSKMRAIFFADVMLLWSGSVRYFSLHSRHLRRLVRLSTHTGLDGSETDSHNFFSSKNRILEHISHKCVFSISCFKSLRRYSQNGHFKNVHPNPAFLGGYRVKISHAL